MPFKIVRNDITKVKADIIVNTANPNPICVSGTDLAIYEAAGKEKLLAERANIGKIARGDIAVTGAYSLNAKYIIHTVGPVWTDGLHHEFEILEDCYRKSLQKALELKCDSIAFPLISTGVYGFPKAADFGDWKETLENLGYYNKIYRLNAQNFGIPQKRERAYMISILCKNNAETIAQVEKYFEEHNLEKDEATRLKQRNLRLKDILCLDYDDVPRYKEEADASKPNDTPSRRKIWEDNELLYDGKEIRDIVVNTVTTKQDRNPNSGLIIYKNRARGKTKWRYLTPRECFKLMGFDESDFDRIISDNPMVTKNRYLYSTEKLIKLAGNSIVVDVLEAIFRQIMDINGKILGERK